MNSVVPSLAGALVGLPAAAQAPGGIAGGQAWLWVGGVAVLLASAWLVRRLLRHRDWLAQMRARNARLTAVNAELRLLADRAEAKVRLLDGAIAAMADGIMITDSGLRIVGWNPRFPEYAGVPRGALRIGMPIEEVIRLQAQAGEFGMVDPEAETARRMRVLRHGPVPERWVRERPDGSYLELRRSALPGGGFVTLYSPVAVPNAVPVEAELLQAFRSEWLSRLPRLMAAAADGDTRAVRAAAHALRGIAANAGWSPLAGLLAEIEAAAEAAQVTELRLLTNDLPLDPPMAA